MKSQFMDTLKNLDLFFFHTLFVGLGLKFGSGKSQDLVLFLRLWTCPDLICEKRADVLSRDMH